MDYIRNLSSKVECSTPWSWSMVDKNLYLATANDTSYKPCSETKYRDFSQTLFSLTSFMEDMDKKCKSKCKPNLDLKWCQVVYISFKTRFKPFSYTFDYKLNHHNQSITSFFAEPCSRQSFTSSRISTDQLPDVFVKENDMGILDTFTINGKYT